MSPGERESILIECAKIAAAEYVYWREAPEPAQNRELAMATHIGAMGAAANICAALFLGKTLAEFETDIATRAGGGA